MMRPIRILYVLNSAGGGASFGIYEMLKRLPRDRFAPYAVIPPGNDIQLQRVRELFADIRTMSVPWWNINRDAGLARRMAWALGRWRRGIVQRDNAGAIGRAIDDWGIDLVHTGTSLTRGGATAAYRRRLPHVWHIKEGIGSRNRVQFPLPDRELVEYMSQRSTRIVAMSHYVAEIFYEHGSRNVKVIPDGVDLQAYGSNASQNLRQRLGLRADQCLVGMVASLSSSWKRHDVFVRMVSLLAREEPGTQFIAIGGKPSGPVRWPHDLPSRYYEGIARLAGDLVPDGKLRFLDSVPDPPDIMRSLDILVHPCDVEPFGRIAIEAMAAGTPVVGPKAGGISETVVDAETGLLVNPDPSSFAEATQRLIRDRGLRQRMGRAGQAHVGRTYTVDRQVERLTNVYSEIIGSR